MLSSLGGRRTCLLLVVSLLFPLLTVEAIQSPLGGVFGVSRGRKGVSPAMPPILMEAPKPQLLNADSNPTLRYPVSVDENSSISCGWFDVTRTGVSYTVVKSGKAGKPSSGAKFMPAGEAHFLAAPAAAASSEEFQASFNEIKGIRIEKTVLLINTPQKKVTLIYLPQYQWGSVEKARQFEAAASQNMAGTMAIQNAMQNFENVLAEVRPPAPPPVEVSLHAEPPTVEKGRPVTLVWNSSNATSLDLEPGVGQVAAAGGMSLVPQDSTNYTLTAAGPAGKKAASILVTVTQPTVPLPTIVLTEPSAGEGQTVAVASSPLTIRGVVMDTSGIPVVTVNGKSVTMRPTSAQAAQFSSDPLDLQPGENKFEVTAVNNAHGQAKVTFIAHLTPSAPQAQPTAPGNSKGLGKAEILSLLQGDVPSARVAELVKERGIKFVPTPDDLKDIRSVGGGDDLIDAINQAPAAARN